jgi:DivIVA domain-containing protein
MYWLQLVVIVALLAAVGWLAIGGGGHMSEPEPDRPDLALPGDGLLAREDVDRVRFSVGARGYRMDEVDDVLDRLAHEIEVREERIAQLEGRAPKQDPSLDEDAGFESEAESESEVEPETETREADEPDEVVARAEDAEKAQ